MAVFQVVSTSVQSSGLQKQRLMQVRRRWYAVMQRLVLILLILVPISVLLFATGLSVWFFILLPLFTSLLWNRSRLPNLLHSPPLYDVLTVGLDLLYFSSITGIQIFIHTPGFGVLFLYHGPPVSMIIVVSTTLAWALILAPLYTAAQAFIEQRFNRRMHENIRAIEAFTSALREEIDLDKVRDGLLKVVQQTIQPEASSVWVRKAGQEETQEPLNDGLYQVSPGEIIIADTDPLIAYALTHPGVLDVNRLRLDSPLLHVLETNAVELLLPLTSQGELIGLLALGPRLNGERYGRQNSALLTTLAAQVAPTLRVTQLVQEQQEQVRERERLDLELQTAQRIQRTFLPKERPLLPGWELAWYYQPAREVGGDFYDFLPFPDGRVGIIIGDVTDKGIPAALVMTATRTMLRTAAQETSAPGEVLTRVNNLLHADIPPAMFVTCFYAILDPKSGRLCYANAGHEPPYHRHEGKVTELWATGMPLGMMPDTCYEEYETTLAPGVSLLFYSDGLVEAHNPQHDLFGFPRLMTAIEEHPGGSELIHFLLGTLAHFTGKNWEQEDDVTLVFLQRERAEGESSGIEDGEELSLLGECRIPSAPGNERVAIKLVSEVAHLPGPRLASLETAVGEAVMNAMEHGNQYQPDKLVIVQVHASRTVLIVSIRDEGEQQPMPSGNETVEPDLEAKLAELQPSRGWGLFLIQHLVDEVYTSADDHGHVVKLVMHLETPDTGDRQSDELK